MRRAVRGALWMLLALAVLASAPITAQTTNVKTSRQSAAGIAALLDSVQARHQQDPRWRGHVYLTGLLTGVHDPTVAAALDRVTHGKRDCSSATLGTFGCATTYPLQATLMARAKTATMPAIEALAQGQWLNVDPIEYGGETVPCGLVRCIWFGPSVYLLPNAINQSVLLLETPDADYAIIGGALTPSGGFSTVLEGPNLGQLLRQQLFLDQVLKQGKLISARGGTVIPPKDRLPGPVGTPLPNPAPDPSGRVPWGQIRSWMREDVGCNFADVLASSFDMVTMSPACTGGYLAPAQLSALKTSGKWVLAYEDIAVAAPWDARAWPGTVNAGSPFLKTVTAWGSYLAEVESDGWFRAVETVIRDDLARGYDGLWLDDCAGFWFEDGPTPVNIARYTALVKRVRALVNSLRPGTKLVCNTDSNLIQGSLRGGSGYLEALDGITIEGFTYHCFTPGDCRANDPSRRSVEGDWAAQAQAHGAKVFVLDYAYDPASQQYAWRETRSRGWTPAVNRGPRLGYWEAD